jgi:PAS domain S-box-containing protein
MIEKPLNILIVEDQPEDRMIIRQSIEESGFTSVIAECDNIDDAIDLCRRENFDCIFLDYYFPQSTGGEFLRYYTNSGGDAAIIVVTCQDDVNMAVECMKNGASDYLTKALLNPVAVARSITNAMRIREVKKSAEQTEKALLESEMRLRSIIGKSPIIFFTIDRSGEFTLFKGKAASVLAIRPEEVVGKNIRDLDHLLPIHIADFNKAIKGEQFQSTAEINQHHFEVNYIPVKNPDRTVSTIMGVAIDITSFKRNEAELMSNLELAEATSRIKEQFLANMSHEIRTPIHGIISLVQFILKTSLAEDQKNYLNLIRKSADTLLVIVNDILDLSKLEAEKMTFEEVDFNLQDTIQSAVAAFIPKTIEKGIELKTSFPDQLPEYINGDPVRLIQIINNLLGNAVKFTEKGFVSLTLQITEQNKDYMVLEFSIKDSGIGIPQHKIASIFDNFSQASSDTARKYGGTGLGLSITQRLIEKQNGMIHVESIPDEGSTFTFRLPYRYANGIVEDTQKNTTMQQGLPAELRLLVAEDNDINRFILQKMLRDWNVTPDFAITGTEAVEMASKKEYDIILMDIEMPGMNGYKATEIIRNEFTSAMRNVPIVAMTGHAMQGERQKCMEAGMTDYLSKPFQPEDLRMLILKLTAKENTTATVIPQETAASEATPSTPPAVKYIDMTFLREISDGNDQFYREFIEMFLANTPVALHDLKESYSNKEWERLRQTSHKMKPSFNYVGLKELNQLSAKVEELAKNCSESAEIEKMINRIIEVSTIALNELKEELNLIPHTK